MAATGRAASGVTDQCDAAFSAREQEADADKRVHNRYRPTRQHLIDQAPCKLDRARSLRAGCFHQVRGPLIIRGEISSADSFVNLHEVGGRLGKPSSLSTHFAGLRPERIGDKAFG